MDLNTAIAVLVQQSTQLVSLVSQLNSLSYQSQELINQENSIPAVNPQIHSLTASMSIVMNSVNSQDILLQQAIDKVAELSVSD